MKQTVKKSDYELYTMNIPLSLRGKKKSSFITKELEKIHPCFSQQCCYDSKLRMKKGKFNSIVAVMDRVKLLEYKGKSKKGISLEGVQNVKFFEERKNFLLFGLIFFAFFLVLIFFNMPKKRITEIVENQTVLQNNIPLNEEILLSSYDWIEKIFFDVNEQMGVIGNFSFCIEPNALDDLNMKMSMEMKNVFPEKISEDLQNVIKDSLSTVSFQSEKPEFNLNLNLNCSAPKSGLKLTFDQMAEIRNCINQDCEILSEDLNENSFNLNVVDKNFCDLFVRLGKIQKDNNLQITKLNIVKGNLSHLISVAFYSCENEINKTELSLFGDFWNLFCEKSKSEKTVSTNKIKSIAPEKKIIEPVVQKNQNYGEKIGGVITKDGRKISYYRGADGKIKGVEE